jgi:GntR family transcriptional regulator, transcriptional repressor for pyruvate dehydrogenase complex
MMVYHHTDMTQGVLISKIERSVSLVDQVIDQIEKLVLEGELSAGEKLPSERLLGERLGVSRTVLREALSALSARGLVQGIVGGGYVVATPNSGVVSSSLSIFLRAGKTELDYSKVHEVRKMLEVEIAGLAATRRSIDHVQQLEFAQTKLRKALNPLDAEAFSDADVEFHVILAQAAENPLMVLLIESVTDVMRDVRRIGGSVPGARRNAIRFHDSILCAVRQGDPNAARSAMAEHLDHSFITMSKALKQSKPEEKIK